MISNTIINLHKMSFKYCPLCVKSDIESKNDIYWHREHQISAATVCIKHKCKLNSMVLPYKFNKQLFYMMDNFIVGDIDYNICYSDYKATKYAIDYLKLDKTYYTNQKYNKLIDKFISLKASEILKSGFKLSKFITLNKLVCNKLTMEMEQYREETFASLIEIMIDKGVDFKNINDINEFLKSPHPIYRKTISESFRLGIIQLYKMYNWMIKDPIPYIYIQCATGMTTKEMLS